MEVIADGIQFPYQTVILKRRRFLWRIAIKKCADICLL